MINHRAQLDGLQVYIDGKMKRLNLMFAVNGGSFAIVKFGAGAGDGDLAGFGALEIPYLATGAIAFTTLMFVAIWYWGWSMRENHGVLGAFNRLGQLSLVAICALLVTGWSLGARLFGDGFSIAIWIFIVSLLALGVIGIVTDYFARKI